MKKSVRFLYLFLGCASAALIAPGANAQSAGPELQFRPAQKWSISATDKLCTIKTTMNNGFGIRVLGNEKWVRALDIDFRQDIFTAGESYDTTLTVPGVTTKTFKAEAQSGSLLAFGIGEDSAFYKALKQSSVMDLALDGNAFRFYLTGFASSADGFESCMADLSSSYTVSAQDTDDGQNFMVNEAVDMEARFRSEEPMEVTEITPAPVAEPDDTEIAPVNEDVDSMAEVPSRVARNPEKRLSQQLAEQIANDPSLIEVEEDAPYIERKKLEVPEEIASMPIVPAPEEDTVITPMEEAAAQEASMQPDASAQEAAAEEPAADEQVAPPPQEILAEPAAEPAPVEAEITAAVTNAEPMPMPEPEDVPPETMTNTETAAPTAAVAEDVTTDTPVEPEPESVTITAKTPPVKVNRTTMSAEADFTQSNANGLGHMNNELRKDVVGLEATVRELKAENEALNAELKKALRESEEERLTISSENWNLEQATMKYNEAERQIQRLGQQLQKERAECDLEKRDLEAMLFDPKVTEQAQLARLSNMEQALQEAKRELEAQRIRYEERIRLLQSTQ